jgi:hypothetical protein
MVDSPAPRNFLMKLRGRLEPQNYEQRLQYVRWERESEKKQVERLSAILAKKANSPRAGLANRAAQFFVGSGDPLASTYPGGS